MSVAMHQKVPVMSLHPSCWTLASCCIWPTEPLVLPECYWALKSGGEYQTGRAYSTLGNTTEVSRPDTYWVGNPKDDQVSLLTASSRLVPFLTAEETWESHHRLSSRSTPSSLAWWTQVMSCPPVQTKSVHSRLFLHVRCTYWNLETSTGKLWDLDQVSCLSIECFIAFVECICYSYEENDVHIGAAVWLCPWGMDTRLWLYIS